MDERTRTRRGFIRSDEEELDQLIDIVRKDRARAAARIWKPAGDRLEAYLKKCPAARNEPEIIEACRAFLEAQDRERQRLIDAGATQAELKEYQSNHYLCDEVLENRNAYLKSIYKVKQKCIQET